MSKIREIAKESDLCAAFIQEFNAVPGWVCYPETAGFDILVVHESGRQIGVEAKLTLNAKVADQILPEWHHEFYGKSGPDHRLVIVAKITDANAGIAKMLERLGVTVLSPGKSSDMQGEYFTFGLDHRLLHRDKSHTYFMHERLFDWWPSERCKVPMMVPNLPAGVPAPIKLTPWKESALKVIALMRRQGFITSKQITAHGIGITSWTQSPGSKPAWLARGTVRGQWVESEHLPAFDKQHPEVYALAVTMVAAELAKPLELGQLELAQ
jgi:hypothetical protein